jgi:hypothetical protein
MYLCLHQSAGLVTASEVAVPTDCPPSDFLAVSSTSLADTLTMSQLFQTYFAFDPALFQQLLGYSILAFIGGLTVGLIIKVMMSTSPGE